MRRVAVGSGREATWSRLLPSLSVKAKLQVRANVIIGTMSVVVFLLVESLLLFTCWGCWCRPSMPKTVELHGSSLAPS